ncbi:MAG: type I DNA topoisomerase [Clostridia bacterium]|nr:type I DNA topoisomerase [Clostridia bacterium]
MAQNTKLVIVESPAKAKTIARYLGRGYKVEASQGHVRDLPKSQLGVDIDHDFEMKYITIHGRGPILAKIRKEAKSASKILLATDPDREGEAISWHLAHVLDIDPASPCRVEFNEITKKAVQQAMKQPRAIDMERVNAQQARRALDRLVGYKISPLLWAKIKKGLSAGRVQSVVTRLIVDREDEIDAFVPEEYWDVTADAVLPDTHGKKRTYTFSLYQLDGKKAALTSEKDALKAKKQIESTEFHAASVKHSEKRKAPSAPFTTSSLQQEASRKLNFTTMKTMQVVQQLYEGVELAGEGTQGLVTYIRTDSVRISDEAVRAARAFIPEEYGKEFLPETPQVYKGRTNAQDAHEAIRPTVIERRPDDIKASLSRDQYLLYKLIWSRFIACQMAPALYDTVTISAEGGKTALRLSCEHKRFAGFTAVYEEGTDDAETAKEVALPNIKADAEISFGSVEATQHFTQPPARYTEASLVKTLEEKGIGRPSTYAPTITTIIARGYVAREKKRLYPTELGRMINQLMIEYFAPIVDTDFTARMEQDLDDIETEGANWHKVVGDFYPDFERMLSKAEQDIDKIEIADEVSDVVCDQCGAKMVYKMGRFGRFLACPNFPECRNTKPILNYIDAPCPKCGARLLEKTSRKNRKFYGCERYPECDFVSWDMPVKEKCPVCGSYMTLKRTRKDEVLHICANESCRHKVAVPVTEEEEA